MKMTPYYIFRSFVIYLAVTIILSESPVSAFTIRRTRTTTLNPFLDLNGEDSVILEVRNDLPKINNQKGNIVQKETLTSPKVTAKTQITTELPTRTSGNALENEKKSSEMIAVPNSPSKNEILQLTSVTDLEKETVPHFTISDKIPSTISYEQNVTAILNINKTVPSQTTDSTTEKATTDMEELIETKTSSNGIVTTTEQNNMDPLQIEEITSVGNHEASSETTAATEAPSSVMTEITFQQLEFLGIRASTNEPLSTTDTTVLESDSPDAMGKENVVTGSSSRSETMTAEESSTVTKNPSWKSYTTIERKRTTSTETDTAGTEQSELFTKAETLVPTKVTLENAVYDTPIPSLNELRQELITNSKTYSTRNNEISTSIPTEQPTVTSPASELLPTSNSHTGPDNIVTSKRAGFLDLTMKQTEPEEATTTDKFNFNETEIIGSMFEVDLQDDSSEIKNGSESQSQLAEDAIKEKLLEEELLNDDLVKNYQGSIVPIGSRKESVTEDSLSVKPISPKTAIYTVSPNYKKMKKIEVQPLKPYIRDPDDNSWRNESLSLLGIVFNAKNASKPFTQVLKNKTEAELNNIENKSERDEKNEVADLRERLEKIAEVRKSRKKKINKAGDTVYSDYEERSSGEITTTPPTEINLPLFNSDGKLDFGEKTTPISPPPIPEVTTLRGVYMYKEGVLTTKNTKKPNKFAEYYDTTDEYDADYITLPKLDLKKFTTSFYNKDTLTTTPMLLTTHTKPLNAHWPDRKPTIQYFPPKPQQPKININVYDMPFEKKYNLFSNDEPPNHVTPMPVTTKPTPAQRTPKSRPQQHAPATPTNEPGNLYKNFYATIPTRPVDSGNRYSVGNDETFNRASYVIKHFKDLIDEAVKDDYDKNGEYIQPYTDSPLTGVTMNEMSKGKQKPSMDDDYDYASNFRKDILNRFVDNFNQNSERFKVDFPILYNSSVVHRQADDSGRVVASSTAFMKRQYGDLLKKPCEPNCELKVELSPAYELHYYVPDQEEKEEAEVKPPTLPYTYRL